MAFIGFEQNFPDFTAHVHMPWRPEDEFNELFTMKCERSQARKKADYRAKTDGFVSSQDTAGVQPGSTVQFLLLSVGGTL